MRDLCDLLWVLQCRLIDRCRLARGGIREPEVTFTVEVEAGDCLVGDETAPFAGLDVELIKRFGPAYLTEEIDLLRVVRPFIVADPVVEGLREHTLSTRLAVDESEDETVALVARHALETVGDITAVGRILR